MGKTKIDVKREYLSRDDCLEEARRLLSEDVVKGMSERQLAGEIYFHAVAFHISEKIGMMPRTRAHAIVVDLDDGGDKLIRRIAYAVVWRLAGLQRRQSSRYDRYRG